MYKEQLDYFILTYQTLSFSTAAKIIPMSSRGLSKAIHSLEDELGVELFCIDSSGAMKATPYATELFGYAKSMSTGYIALQGSFERLRARERQEIKLGVSMGILGAFGLGIINSFESLYPSVKVIYDERADYPCDSALKQNEYDLAFTKAPYNHQFLTTELLEDPIGFWVHRDNPLSSLKALTIEEKWHTIPGQ